LDASGEDQKNMIANAPGVPADTSVLNPNNELAEWIKDARNTNPKLRICIKADGDASYPSVNKIIKTLAGWKIFKFNLITNLKEVPKGSAAYDLQHAGEKK
jgi:biopolymer transport protein ExbD